MKKNVYRIPLLLGVTAHLVAIVLAVLGYPLWIVFTVVSVGAVVVSAAFVLTARANTATSGPDSPGHPVPQPRNASRSRQRARRRGGNSGSGSDSGGFWGGWGDSDSGGGSDGGGGGGGGD